MYSIYYYFALLHLSHSIWDHFLPGEPLEFPLCGLVGIVMSPFARLKMPVFCYSLETHFC